MDNSEEAIAARLRENIPRPVEPSSEPEKPTQPDAKPTAELAVPIELDEMSMYKLHEFFGESYRTTDEQNKKRAKYVYEIVANEIGTAEYGYVVAKISSIEQMIGTAHGPDRLYKVYQWLRLNSARLNIEAEMSAIHA